MKTYQVPFKSKMLTHAVPNKSLVVEVICASSLALLSVLALAHSIHPLF